MEIGRYHCTTARWQEVEYTIADQLWEQHQRAKEQERVQERYWRESEFGWLSTADPRALHGVYKQLIPNRKGKYASGSCRVFMDENPQKAQEMALFVAKSLERVGMPHHATKVYQQYGLAQYCVPSEEEWSAMHASRAAKRTEEEQRARAKFSAAVAQFWGTEEQLDSYIARMWPSAVTETGRETLKRTVVKYGENRWWEKRDAEAALPQLFEPRFLLPMERFLNGCAELIGRPISLIEYAFEAEQIQLQVLAKVERSVLDTLKANKTPGRATALR